MAHIPDQCTVVIKSFKASEFEEVRQCVFQTRGLIPHSEPVMINDRVPDFPHAKLMFCNYQSPQAAEQAAFAMMAECDRHGWGNGASRATTKDKLLKPFPKKKDHCQIFPVHVSGFAAGDPSTLERELEMCYSAYGPCWVKVKDCDKDDQNSEQYAFVNFSEFDSALRALRDKCGVKLGDAVLKPKTAFDTAWSLHVWEKMRITSRLSLDELQAMATAGVGPKYRKYFPKDYLHPLQKIPHFQVNLSTKEVTWTQPNQRFQSAESGDALQGFQSAEFGDSSADWSSLPSESHSPEPDTLSPPNASNPGQHAQNLESPGTGSPKPGLQNVPVVAFPSGCELTECGTPERFVCPISLQIMVDPVRLSNGQVFERGQIEKYLRDGNSVCPKTKVPIDPAIVVPVAQLKDEIVQYQRANADSLPLLSNRHSTDATQSCVEVLSFSGHGTGRTYELVQPLGGGGMGKVYRARIQSSSSGQYNVFALKVCSALRDGRTERNDREAQNLLRLQSIQHNNVIRLFDSGVSGTGDVVLVMEVVEPGLTLKELLDLPRTNLNMSKLEQLRPIISQSYLVVTAEGRCRLCFPLCGDVMTQMIEGIVAVHSMDIAHRNLKPSNVMVQKQDLCLRVVILDFGLSKATCGNDADQTVTMAGQALGTPSYMSPEHIQGLASTPESALAADLWSLGVMLHMMIEGRHPFSADTHVPPRNEAEKATLTHNIQKLDLQPLRHSPDGHAFCFLTQALEKRVERRFPSAQRMRDAFRTVHCGHAKTDAGSATRALSSCTLQSLLAQFPSAPQALPQTQVDDYLKQVITENEMLKTEKAKLEENAAENARLLESLQNDYNVLKQNKSLTGAKDITHRQLTNATSMEGRCEQVETKFFGEVCSGPLKKRIEELEEQVLGCVQSGGLMTRLKAIESV